MRLKRLFDMLFSLVGLLAMGWLLVIVYVLVSIDTTSNGIFLQKRIGQFGKDFMIFKFKTIHPKTNKISRIGKFLRKSKIDELPQLGNILIGDMSFVGPRPDIPGYYDMLKGEDRRVLMLKPGLTGPASIKYSNEEALLKSQKEPLKFNDEIIFPDKVSINLAYQSKQSFWLDLKILYFTILNKQVEL